MKDNQIKVNMKNAYDNELNFYTSDQFNVKRTGQS